MFFYLHLLYIFSLSFYYYLNYLHSKSENNISIIYIYHILLSKIINIDFNFVIQPIFDQNQYSYVKIIIFIHFQKIYQVLIFLTILLIMIIIKMLKQIVKKKYNFFLFHQYKLKIILILFYFQFYLISFFFVRFLHLDLNIQQQ